MSFWKYTNMGCLCLALCILLVGNVCAKPPKDTRAEEANKNAEFPEEDSDMLMEPNDFTPITVLRSHERQYHLPPTEQFRPIPNPALVSRIDRPAVAHDSHTQAAQNNFYPPFFRDAPPLGHSRPYFTGAPEAHNVVPPLINKYALPHNEPNGPIIQAAAPPTQRSYDPSILGSGDFGVLRGGTFYPEEEMPYHPDDNSDYIYGNDGNNGHGRPAADGFVQKYTYPEEQFAHFRDFADINTPADGAFSHFVVVYANKNSTAPHSHPKPKNIFEQLELLDREKALEERQQKPNKSNKQGLSKSKLKLAKTKLQKKYKKQTSPKDLDNYEPLLALS